MSIRQRFEALQETLLQPVETVTRAARLDVAGTGVDEIDPPDDIDEFHEQYRNTGIARSNLNQFVSDVVEPGVRVEAENDQTADYFMGGDSAPDDTPDGGFLANSFVLAGQKHQDFHPGLKSTVLQRWTRGTAMVELLKENPESAESEITGFYHIRPETITAQTYPNQNILIDPDDTDQEGITLTNRDEAAAYIQFDDQSILGRRVGGFDRSEIPLSQNDVLKQVLDPDIGGNSTDEEGIFGTSIFESISTDVKEYNEIKRDRARAIKTKAYGVWDASFEKEVHDLGSEIEVTQWSDEDIDDWIADVDEMGPGEIVGHDGSIDLQRFESDVPDLEGVLGHYVDDITAPLPAPKYAVGFEENINQFISQQQENRYHQLINEERRYQERSWTDVFRTIADRKGMNPNGLRVLIEPEEEESPVMSLDSEDMERLTQYTQALKDIYGSGGTTSFIDEETLAELVLQLPEDAIAEMDIEEMPIPEENPDVQAQFQAGQQTQAATDGGEPEEEGEEESEE